MLDWNFNSIKVQLKLKANDINKIEDLFQFHKGTIKTLYLVSLLSALWYFNSIKVQLKPTRYTRAHGNQQFQFHKGTIKTPILQARKGAWRISIP